MQDYNKSTVEYGSSADESLSSSEAAAVHEGQSYEELKSASEGNNTQSTSKKVKGKSMVLTRLLATFVAGTAALVVIGESIGVLNSGTNSNEPIVDNVVIATTGTEVYYSLDLESEQPLQIILENDFTNRTAQLVQGENDGAFRELASNMRYTLSVIGAGTFGEKTIVSWQIKTLPHPIDEAAAQIKRLDSEFDTISYSVQVEGEVPFKLVLSGGGVLREIPLENGLNDGSFDGVPMGAEYVLSIFGEGPLGESRLLDSADILLDEHPIDVAVADIVSFGSNMNTVSFEAAVDCDMPLKMVLYNDAIRFEQLLSNGNSSGIFEGVPMDATYTMAIVGDYLGQETELESVSVTLPKHPLDEAAVSIINTTVELDTVKYIVAVNCTLPLKVVLYNDSTRLEIPLVNGENDGSFEAVPMGAEYTMAIVGDRLGQEKELQSVSVTLPKHPLDEATALIINTSVDLDTVEYIVTVDCTLPLKVVLYNDSTRFEMPLANGENNGSFEAVPTGEEYSLAIVGDYFGQERVLTSTGIVVDDYALNSGTATFIDCAPDGLAIYYTVEVSSEIPTRLVVTGAEGVVREDSLANGTNEGGVIDLQPGITYTLSVVDENGYVLAAESVYLEDFELMPDAGNP